MERTVFSWDIAISILLSLTRFHIALAGSLFLKSILRQIALYHSNGFADAIFATKGSEIDLTLRSAIYQMGVGRINLLSLYLIVGWCLRKGKEMTQVEQLAAFVEQTKYEDLSEEARQQLKIRILDALGCAYGALDGAPSKSCKPNLKTLAASPW
jgi:MmgE/PrpD N-terminal domain